MNTYVVLQNMILRLFCFLLCFFSCFLVFSEESCIPTYLDDEVKTRVKTMPLMFKSKYDDIVASYVKTYFVKARPKAARIIGHTSMYFPIFEKYIKEKNLPMDLRFLPIVESALDPNAVSRSAATGLWQFMKPTGEEYGLYNNHFVEERKDPHRSTKAALTYLEKLYSKYGDWSLALAAYNGGPGTVNRAIKRGKSKNFWKIKKYLPKETRNYIPAFTAAAYLFNYYEYHDITPAYPEIQLQMTDHTMVYEEISFDQISGITGIPSYTIEYLNPSYKKKIIPKSYNGNYLILPTWAIEIMDPFLLKPNQKFIVKTGQVNRAENINYLKTTYTVQVSDNLTKVGEIFKCDPYLVKLWNNLRRDHLIPGEKLNVYIVTSNIKIESEKKKVIPLNKLPEQKIQTINVLQALKPKRQKAEKYHIIKEGESILAISKLYPNVNLTDILEANSWLNKRKAIFPGKKIIIP